MANSNKSPLSLLNEIPRGVIPRGVMAKLAARITSCESINRDDMNLRAVDLAAPIRKTADCPVPSFPLGGKVSPTDHDKPRTVNIVTWNTGEPINLNETGNMSHAERQFIEYMNKKNDRDKTFFASITHIQLDINISPCTNCADMLAFLLSEIKSQSKVLDGQKTTSKIEVLPQKTSAGGRRLRVHTAPPPISTLLSATLRWGKLYTSGPQATNWQSLSILNKAGWQLISPRNSRPSDGSVYATMVLVNDL